VKAGHTIESGSKAIIGDIARALDQEKMYFDLGNRVEDGELVWWIKLRRAAGDGA
jgi:hypothetical protein